MGINSISLHSRKLLGLILFLIQMLISTAFAFDTCEDQDMLAPRATLVLKNTSVDKNGNFSGLFEFHNFDLAPTVTILGARNGGFFVVSRPQARIEFRDLNGRWTLLSIMPLEEFLDTSSRLSIASRSKMVFKTVLFPQELVANDGSDFRLLLSLSTPSTCVASIPFRAYPGRSQIQGFVSSASGKKSRLNGAGGG